MSNTIISTSIVLGIFLSIFVLIYYIIGYKNLQKSKKYYENLHQNLKSGKKIEFCGGIYGVVKNVQDDMVDVEISKGNIIQVSRYAVTKIL